MAKKQRDQPAQLPPSSSSSEGEESSSSSDQEQTSNSSIPHPKKLPIQNKPSESEEESSDDEEDEDEDENPQSVKKPTSNSSIGHSKKREIQNKNSQSDEESSDDEDEKPQPAKKPTINSSIPQPKNSPVQNQKSISEEDSSDEEADDDGEKPQHVKTSTSSKPKLKPKSLSTPNKSNGKPPIVRIWSVDDEIMILQAMLEHQSNNECIELNATGIKDLYDSIKKKLSIDVDIAKLVEKIRRIRKKYMGASKKGANLKFPKAHDKTIYDLSDKIWGKKEEEVGFVVNNNSHDATMSEEKSLKREFPFIRDALGGNKLALEMLEKVDVKKAVALEEKFKKLKYAEHSVMREVYNLLR